MQGLPCLSSCNTCPDVGVLFTSAGFLQMLNLQAFIGRDQMQVSYLVPKFIWPSSCKHAEHAPLDLSAIADVLRGKTREHCSSCCTI